MPVLDDARTVLTRAGLNLIQQALSIFDSELRLAVCNRRYQEMFDFPDAYVSPGVGFEDTIRYLVQRGEYGVVDDPEAAVRLRVEAALAFVPHYLERQRPNGRWVSVEGTPLPQGGWVTVYTDITEVRIQQQMLRARSEELSEKLLSNTERLSEANRALRSSNAALEEAKRELTEIEARTRLTAEMMPAHIAHVDRSFRYTYSNRRLASVIPGAPSQIVGLSGSQALGPANFAKIAPHLDKALGGEPSVFEFTDDSSGRRIRAALTPDRTNDGPINGVYILSMDVTEESQARAALMQTRKRELAAQLTSGLAHDFGNLLTIILGLQSRLAGLDLPEGGRDLVASTVAAARRGGMLLDRIASISGRRELQPVAVDVGAFLSDFRLLAESVLPDGIRLEIALEEPLAPLLLDVGTVQDSLLNLVLNARDAIGRGPGAVTVKVRPVHATWLEFVVTDTGAGFSPPALECAIDPFFTTKGGEGSGLGLSMVYDQTSLAGGTLRIGNRPDGGARVELRLPYRPAPPPGKAHMVLLVEDSDEIRESVRGMLRSLGHNVIEATTAEEAEKIADLPGIDFILSDINLAGATTGLDLAERLRARGRTGGIGLMTSLPPANPLRARAVERFPVLAKPFDGALLSSFLTTVRAEVAR